MSITAVAEGIEDVRTFELLRGTGCDTGQGYLIRKPVPASELDDWLRNGAWLPRAESERAA